MADLVKAKIDAKNDITGPSLWTEDSIKVAQGTFVQKGQYTMFASKSFVTLQRNIISASSNPQTAVYMVTSKTANHHFVESFAVSAVFGVSNYLSSISGFTVSTTASNVADTGYWLCLAYK